MGKHVHKLIHILGMHFSFELPFLLTLLTGQIIFALVNQNLWIMLEGVHCHQAPLILIELAVEFESLVLLLLQSCHWCRVG